MYTATSWASLCQLLRGSKHLTPIEMLMLFRDWSHSASTPLRTTCIISIDQLIYRYRSIYLTASDAGLYMCQNMLTHTSADQLLTADGHVMLRCADRCIFISEYYYCNCKYTWCIYDKQTETVQYSCQIAWQGMTQFYMQSIYDQQTQKEMVQYSCQIVWPGMTQIYTHR